MTRARVFDAIATAVLLGAAAAEADTALPLDQRGRSAPAELLRQIRAPRLDVGGAAVLRGLDVQMGLGRLGIDQGILVPSRLADGRVIELVFVGQARFHIDPPNAIEAEQLELFSGRRTLDVAVHEAVLVFGDEEVVERLLAQPRAAPANGRNLEQAAALHERWLASPERAQAGVEAATFKFLAGDQAFRDYLGVWCASREVGDFVFQLDPEDGEPLTVARFTPLDVRGWDRARLSREIRIQQRKGRWLGVRVEDLGAWDVWLSAAWAPRDGAAYPGNSGFEARHYALDVTIPRSKTELAGHGTIELETLTAGRRVVTLDLFRDLEIDRVRDASGRELFAFRSGPVVLVHLPEPSRAGETLHLAVEWSGRALTWVGPQSWDLEDTSGWHPHCGSIDRATYDVTLRWPAGVDLLASGRLVEHGRSAKMRWERRRIDRPSAAFSFVLGDFLVETTRHDDVTVRMAFHRAAPWRLDAPRRAATTATVTRALDYFESSFGPYPLDELSVVLLPRRYSQSYLGFVTLTERVLAGESAFSSGSLDFVRETHVAHELAHQWWGNLIGWESYRDQWLSEAMANYASLLYYAQLRGDASTLPVELSAGWRESLGQRTGDGRLIGELGPVVLGSRLNSSISSGAYRAIVYRKGAVVLGMLARAVGERAFQAMLRELAQAAADRVLTTESFLAAIERMSGQELEGFARMFVYGTGIPQLYYDYDAAQLADGAWTLRGQVRVVREPAVTFEVVALPGGGLDVQRHVELPDAAELHTPAWSVPFRITHADEDGPQRSRSGKIVRAEWGRLALEGPAQEFELASRERPLEFELDPRGELLARFWPFDLNPKRALRYRAQEQAAAGDLEAAERSYREALTQRFAPIPRDESDAWVRNPEHEGRAEDARARLGLARLHVDRGRTERALEELAAVDTLLADAVQALRMDRDVVASRLETRRGDWEPALKRLRKTMQLVKPASDVVSWRDAATRLQLTADRAAVTEGWMLLAIAAHGAGQRLERDRALGELRGRGVDLLQLERVLETMPP